MDKWTTGRVPPVAHLSTAPATTAAAGWFPFQSSNGSLFGCQSASRLAEVVPFSTVKWFPFQLTKGHLRRMRVQNTRLCLRAKRVPYSLLSSAGH